MSEDSGLVNIAQELLADYIKGFSRMRGRLQLAMTENDIPKLQELLHNISRSGSVYGFTELCDLAAQAEQKILGKETTRPAAPEVTAILRLMFRVETNAAGSPLAAHA